MKSVFLILFLFLFHFSKGQAYIEVSRIFQSLLDDPELIKEIEQYDNLICDSTLFYVSTGLDSTTNLTFRGIPLILWKRGVNDSLDCAKLTIDVNQINYNKKYRVRVKVQHWIDHPPCATITEAILKCDLKYKRGEFRLKNKEVYSRTRVPKFL